MNTEQERAEFEAWHEERYGEPAGEFKSSGFYDNHEVQAEWRGWQARAALLAERDALETEGLEQARLNGIGSEREARLMAERDILKAALESIEPMYSYDMPVGEAATGLYTATRIARAALAQENADAE